MKAIEALIESQGGPEVIEWRDVTLGDPGPGQVLIRQTAVGLNYLDTYHRDGTYPVPPPSGLGVESAGEVVAVGAGRMEDGKLVPISVKAGDEVLFQWGDKIKVGDEEYYIVKESEILAIIK